MKLAKFLIVQRVIQRRSRRISSSHIFSTVYHLLLAQSSLYPTVPAGLEARSSIVLEDFMDNYEEAG